MKAQVSDLGLRHSWSVPPGSGGVPPIVPTAFLRLGTGRGNGFGEALESGGGVGAHPGQEMLVGLDRVGDVGVAEALGHDLHRDAFLDEQAPVGVAQVVEAQGRYVRVRHDAPERLVEGVRVDGVAVAVGEHPAFLVVDADGGELGGLERPPSLEDGEGGVVEVDVAAGGLGLAARLVEVVADGDEAAVEGDALLGRV